MKLKKEAKRWVDGLLNFGVDAVSSEVRMRGISEKEKPAEDEEVSEAPELVGYDEDPFISNVRAMEDPAGLFEFGYKKVSHVGQEAPPVKQKAEPVGYGEEAKTYRGQSDVDYCIECAVKHGQTAKVLMREALQRAEAGDPADKGVMEKVRGVTEEICGLEDDTTTVGIPRVSALNAMARSMRKHIYESGAEIGRASVSDLEKIKGMVDKLVEVTYMAREAEECPECNLEAGRSP